MNVAIKCYKKDCKFRDKRGYCTLDSIEINEEGKCDDYEQDEKKAIVEHNARIGGLLEQLGKMETLSEKDKDYLATLLVLAMKTEDGETVADKLFTDLEERDAH